MIYRLLKLLIGIGIKLYYKEIHIKNFKGLNHDGPKILIANHPNTLMDAWILGQISKKPVHFMSKGTFFNSPLKSRFLRSLGIIPINRATEKKTHGVDNSNSFDACYKVLEEGKTLVIFPEGNSYPERVLRELKTGTARIALEAEHRNSGKLNLQVIPVGLIYTDAAKFRSSVVANVGKGIEPAHFLKEYTADSKSASKKLTEEFKDAMEELLVGSTSVDTEKLVDGITQLLSSKYTKEEEKGVKKELVKIRDTYQKINDIMISNPRKMLDITMLYTQIKLQLKQSEIKSDFLDRDYRRIRFLGQMFLSSLFIIIAFPFFLFGIIHNILPFQIIDRIIPRIVKEIEYYAPVAVLMGLVAYPLNYFGFVVLVDSFFPLTLWIKVLYFFSMPVFGLFAYYFYQYLQHISLKAHFMYMMKNDKDRVKAIRHSKEDLREMIFGED